MSTTTKSKSAPSAADTVKQIEDAVTVQQGTIDTVVKAGVEGVDQAVALTRDHVEAAVKAGAEAFKGYEEFFQFGKDNMDALVKTSSILVRGVQDISKTFAALTQESIEESVSASRALFTAKTIKEVIDLSSSLARSNFDRMVAESTRVTQLSTRLAEEAFAPLTGRVEVALQKLTKTAA